MQTFWSLANCPAVGYLTSSSAYTCLVSCQEKRKKSSACFPHLWDKGLKMHQLLATLYFQSPIIRATVPTVESIAYNCSSSIILSDLILNIELHSRKVCKLILLTTSPFGVLTFNKGVKDLKSSVKTLDLNLTKTSNKDLLILS